MLDVKFVNVLILGFGFMFLFTSFQTMGNIEQTLIKAMKKDHPGFANADAYTSLAIIYAMLAICNWLAPSFLSSTGPRAAMLIGGTTYCIFILTFLWPQIWLLYLASAILGAGASITWTGQGNFLSRCSDSANISRNSGIFWALLQCSMFFGNLFVYYQFQNEQKISESQTLVISVLVAVAILGVIFLGALRPVPDSAADAAAANDDNELDNNDRTKYGETLYALKAAWKLFLTKDILLLSITFVYTGLELTFFSGVYGSAVGFTLNISSTPKEIVGLCGIFIGVGEVLGGGLFSILGSKTTRFGRDPVVILGFIIHIIAFFLIFINLPNLIPNANTTENGYLDPPQPWIALLCAFMLGFGDACFNTQIYSMLGGVYAKNSIGAFALFKFTQSVGAAVSFAYSSSISIRIQLGILLFFATVGTASFCVVEWKHKRNARQITGQQENISDNSSSD